MTKRGEEITITCWGCDEEHTYVFDRGRIRQFHPPDHKGPDGELTHCKRTYSNNDQRNARARQIKAEEQSRIQAQVDAQIERAIRARVPVSLTNEERADLLARIASIRAALTLLRGRTHEKASAPVTLGHYRDEVEDRFVPLLDQVERVLRRT